MRCVKPLNLRRALEAHASFYTHDLFPDATAVTQPKRGKWAIAPPKFSKTRLVVRYNINLQSFCPPPRKYQLVVALCLCNLVLLQFRVGLLYTIQLLTCVISPFAAACGELIQLDLKKRRCRLQTMQFGRQRVEVNQVCRVRIAESRE